MLDDYLDALEASRVLGIHPESVKRLIRYQKLPGQKIGNKWYVKRDVLDAFIGTRQLRTGRTHEEVNLSPTSKSILGLGELWQPDWPSKFV